MYAWFETGLLIHHYLPVPATEDLLSLLDCLPTILSAAIRRSSFASLDPPLQPLLPKALAGIELRELTVELGVTVKRCKLGGWASTARVVQIMVQQTYTHNVLLDTLTRLLRVQIRA